MSIIEKTLQYAYKNCIPLIATIETTLQCNFRCHHCYNFDRNEIKKLKEKTTLPSETVKRVIQELADLGTLFINFTGGEALTDPHLIEYITFTRSISLEPRLKTNGSLLTKENCQKLKEAGLGGMDISLYGGSAKTYESFVQGDHFEKVVEGLQNAKEHGFSVQLSFILHRGNVSEINQMIELAERFNFPYQFSTEITERYDQTEDSRIHEMTKEQYIDLLDGEHQNFFRYHNKEKALQCSCARSIIGISARGEVYPCIGAPIPSGNVNSSSLKMIWNESPTLKRIRDLGNDDFKECQTCEYIEGCNRSSGSMYTNTGNYTGCEPKVLEQAKLQVKRIKKS